MQPNIIFECHKSDPHAQRNNKMKLVFYAFISEQIRAQKISRTQMRMRWKRSVFLIQSCLY